VTTKDLHYYEPKNGHRLKHDPFNAIVAPRPIGWISSRDGQGNVNLAPYSFFNAFCYVPPIIGFSSTNWKDSAGNIQDTGEFVWNLATMDLAKQMNATAAHVARDVDEFKIAGLTAAPCKLVTRAMGGVVGARRRSFMSIHRSLGMHCRRARNRRGIAGWRVRPARRRRVGSHVLHAWSSGWPSRPRRVPASAQHNVE